MRRIRILPYKMGSRSARDISRKLGIRRLRNPSNMVPRTSDVIINWGSTTNPFVGGAAPLWLNSPNIVRNNANKLLFFNRMEIWNRENDGDDCVNIPEWTTNPEVAQQWLHEKPNTAILCRRLVNASGGRGIVVATAPEELVDAPLYTRYVKKVDEYRIHIFKPDNVIRTQHKRRRQGEDADNAIRNHDNGWVFCMQEVNPPDVVMQQAFNCIQASGLDFGAVDVIYNQKYDKAYVLEINTACGIEGSTLLNYVYTFNSIINNILY